MSAAIGAVGRFTRRLQHEWKQGQSEAGQPLDDDDAPPAKPPVRAAVKEAWWDVLQVSPTATDDEIRASYRRLIKDHHPDRATHLPAELQAEMERATKRLNEAYELALKRQA